MVGSEGGWVKVRSEAAWSEESRLWKTLAGQTTDYILSGWGLSVVREGTWGENTKDERDQSDGALLGCNRNSTR